MGGVTNYPKITNTGRVIPTNISYVGDGGNYSTLQAAFDDILAKDQVDVVSSTSGIGLGTALSGTVAVNQDSCTVTGTSTAFLPTSEAAVYPLYISFGTGTDINARKWYKIRETLGQTELTLDVPFQEANITGEDYALGYPIIRCIELLPGVTSLGNVTATTDTGFVVITGRPGASYQGSITHDFECGLLGLKDISLKKYTSTASLAGYTSAANRDTSICDLWLEGVDYESGAAQDGILRGGGSAYVKNSRFKSTWHVDSFANVFLGTVLLEDSRFTVTYSSSGYEVPNYSAGNSGAITSLQIARRCVFEIPAVEGGSTKFEFAAKIAGSTQYDVYEDCEFHVFVADGAYSTGVALILISTITNNSTATLNAYFKGCRWTIDPQVVTDTITPVFTLNGTENLTLEDCRFPSGITDNSTFSSNTTVTFDGQEADFTTAILADIVHHNKLLRIDATSAPLAPTLPLSSRVPGMRVGFMKIDSGANAVTVTRTGADTINGGTTSALSAQYDYVWLEATAANGWVIIG